LINTRLYWDLWWSWSKKYADKKSLHSFGTKPFLTIMVDLPHLLLEIDRLRLQIKMLKRTVGGK